MFVDACAGFFTGVAPPVAGAFVGNFAGVLTGVLAGVLTGIGAPPFVVVLGAAVEGFLTGDDPTAGFDGVVTGFWLFDAGAGFFTGCGVDLAGVVVFTGAFAGVAFVGVFFGGSLSTILIFDMPSLLTVSKAFSRVLHFLALKMLRLQHNTSLSLRI